MSENILEKIIEKKIIKINNLKKTLALESLKDIIDKKRIKVILKTIAKKSKINKIDPLITKKIWSSMIKAFIDYEFRNFKK